MKAIPTLAAILLISAVNFTAATVSNGCSVSGRSAKAGRSSRTYTLATYNVGAFNKYEASSVAAIAQSVKDLGCDIISLNELDSCTRRTGNVDQLKEFSRILGGWEYSFGRAISFQGGSYGIGVALRSDIPVLSSYDVPLERGEGSEDRDLKVIETPDFVFASTHLDFKTGPSQLAQARKVSETLASRYGSTSEGSASRHPKPVFLCGDMNSTPDSDILEYFRKGWTVLTPEGITFPFAPEDKRGAGICIDYIMLLDNGSKVKVLDSEIISSNSLSDHFPVVLKVRL